MAATISVNGDWVDYLTNEWLTSFSAPNFGDFYPGGYDPTDPTQVYTQWGSGSSTASAVVLNGSFTYVQGDLEGTINTLVFGSGLTGSGTAGFGVATPEVTVNLGGASSPDAFDNAIYNLIYGSFTGNATRGGLFDYFGEVGTVQNGGSGEDVLYSFDGNDDLNGGAGIDVFVFNRSISGSQAASIGEDTVSGFTAGLDGDYIDLAGLGSTAFDTFAEVYAASSQVGSDTVIDFGTLGEITLEGVTRTALIEDNFLFA